MGPIIWILLCLCTTAYAQEKHRIRFWHSWQWNYQHPVHYGMEDGMHYTETETMKNLTLELVQEMRLKYRQLHGVRQYHLHRIGFEIGSVMGQVRAKYKRIMEHYRELVERRRGRNQMYPPGIWWNRPFHYMIGVEVIKGLEMEIDKLIHVLLSIPKDSLNAELNLAGEGLASDKTKQNKGGGSLRKGPEREEARSINFTLPDDIVHSGTPRPFRTEQELKQYFREKFEKEHSNKDKEWSLDKYYGLA